MITTLSQLVALVESANTLYALRFEPHWQYTTQADIANCIRSHAPAYMNQSTARNILAMSWGRYQIMGSNLYSLGYRSTLAHFLTDSNVQDAFFDEYCKSRGLHYELKDVILDPVKAKDFAIKYNGSSDYALSLTRAYALAQKDAQS